MSMRVSFHTLGCKVNFAETSTLAREFAAAGFERVGAGTDENTEETASKIPVADVYVVNTCSVTASADKKCRNLIARLHRRSPGAKIIVTGCYAQRAHDEVAALPGVSMVFGNGDKDKIVAGACGELQILNSQLPPSRNASTSLRLTVGARSMIICFAKNSQFSTLPPSVFSAPPLCGDLRTSVGEPRIYDARFNFYPAFSVGDRTRSFLKVQDGCDYKCSYCAIHSARGASRNAPIANIVEQARRIAGNGVKEIVITGVNTGDFGRTTGESFLDLLRSLDTVEGVERYRISSIEPNLLTDGIIAFCAASRKFQSHFHIPLQSGSDRILGLMRRRYTTARFADRVSKIREKMPDAFIGIDVIVGFPGETNEDFAETRAFLERLRPSQLHVFPYSVRPGTPAAAMPGRVPTKIATERAATLGVLSDTLLKEFTARFAGTTAEVLWEGGIPHRPRPACQPKAGAGQSREITPPADKVARGMDPGRLMSGFTGNYLKVTAPYDPALVNTITKIVI